MNPFALIQLVSFKPVFIPHIALSLSVLIKTEGTEYYLFHVSRAKRSLYVLWQNMTKSEAVYKNTALSTVFRPVATVLQLWSASRVLPRVLHVRRFK